MIKLSDANRKLEKLLASPEGRRYTLDGGTKAYSFDLPAGHTCPAANVCHAQAERSSSGAVRIVDGPTMIVRCYAASAEVAYPTVYRRRRDNQAAIAEALHTGGVAGAAAAIKAAIPPDAGIVRIHSSGDFFVRDYFAAWVEVARRSPCTLFYGYTKSAVVWYRRLDESGCRPPNFRLVASRGGLLDRHIGRMRSALIVETERQARLARLRIDHDDSLAAFGTEDFALLVHGPQPAGTELAKLANAHKYEYA